MHTDVEVVLSGGSLTAHVTCGEWPEVGTPTIITTPGHLDTDFEWDQSGAIWHILPATAKWTLECVFEMQGPGEIDPLRPYPTYEVPHVPADSHHYQQSLHVGVHGQPPASGTATPYFDYLDAGHIYAVFTKLSLIVGGHVIACGFGRCPDIHMMEIPPHP